MRSVFFAVLVIAAACPAATAQQPVRAIEIERAFLSVGERIRWPGFEPARIPLAIYDGLATTLFRHPAPPTGFVPVVGTAQGTVMPGRHPAVTANSSAEIGGRGTATLISSRQADVRVNSRGASRESTRLAALALHEAFHVFQRERHAGWVGNEADLFTYPVDHAQQLALRRLETDALKRAQRSTDVAHAACWARAFVDLRDARYAGLDSAFSRYERLTELNEGLANYVQILANGQRAAPFPPHEFAPSAVRLRTYTIGPAIAFLLDRLSPQWQASLEANDHQSLDGLLADALGRAPASVRTCLHSAHERASAQRVARSDSVAIVGNRTARRAAFDARRGARLVVVAAEDAPFWPKGFDPLNVERVDNGLLHTRFLALNNDAGTIEVLDEDTATIEVLTIAAGSHPLFNGVRQVNVVGFRSPEVNEQGDSVTVVAKGLRLALHGATVRRNGDSLVVTVPKPRNLR